MAQAVVSPLGMSHTKEVPGLTKERLYLSAAQRRRRKSISRAHFGSVSGVRRRSAEENG